MVPIDCVVLDHIKWDIGYEIHISSNCRSVEEYFNGKQKTWSCFIIITNTLSLICKE